MGKLPLVDKIYNSRTSANKGNKNVIQIEILRTEAWMTCDDTLGCELIWMLILLSHRQSTGVMLLLQHSASLLLALSTCSLIHTDTQITKLKAHSLAFSISLWVVKKNVQSEL